MEAGKTGSIKMPNTFAVDSIDIIARKCSKIITTTVVNYASRKYTKIYFAGPWFDEKSKVLYKTCETIISELKEISKFANVYFPKNEVNNSPLEAFEKNVKNIKDSDVIIALVSKKDVGTAWEIGMAYALNKTIYLLGYDESTFLSHTNVMLAFTGKCFTLDKLGKFLTQGLSEEDFVKINNEWEGIE